MKMLNIIKHTSSRKQSPLMRLRTSAHYAAIILDDCLLNMSMGQPKRMRVYSVCVCVCVCVFWCVLGMMWNTWEKNRLRSWLVPNLVVGQAKQIRALHAQSYVLLNLTSSIGWQVHRLTASHMHVSIHVNHSLCQNVMWETWSMTCLHAKVTVI